jgi:hypothetical protein
MVLLSGLLRKVHVACHFFIPLRRFLNHRFQASIGLSFRGHDRIACQSVVWGRTSGFE